MPTQQLKSSLKLLAQYPISIIIFSVWFSFLLALWSGVTQAGDFYPIYVGIQAMFRGVSPYSADVANAIKSTWSVGQDSHLPTICAYPLPALLLFSPLGFLPLEVTGIIWRYLLLAAIFVGWLSMKERQAAFIGLLLFFPVSHVLFIQNASALWFGLSLIVMSQAISLSPVLRSVLCFVLCLKPQAGCVYALYLLIKSGENLGRTLACFFVISAVFLGASWLVQPSWLQEWLATGFQYREILNSDPIWIPRIVLALLTIGLKLEIAVPVIQFAIFPPTDIYSTLPLFLLWTSAPRKVGLVGYLIAATSTLNYVYSRESLLLVLPLCLPAAIWLGYLQWQRFSARRIQHLQG